MMGPLIELGKRNVLAPTEPVNREPPIWTPVPVDHTDRRGSVKRF